MYILLNWFLRSISKDTVIAQGNVINNPKFYSGQNIFTSKIEGVFIDNENKQFIFTTYSGSNYIVKFEEINIENSESIKECFRILNIPNDYLNICESLYRADKERLKKYVGKILNPNELYIELAGISFMKAVFMTNERYIKEIPIRIHLGMFQDSVLITDFYDHLIDIRFWDINNKTITPYRWNEGLESIKIYNVGDDILYKKGEVETVLKHNELIEIKYEH